MTVRVQMSSGLVALVDDEDAALVAGHSWHPIYTGGGNVHARTTVSRRPSKHLGMHRLITGWRCQDIDHINGNGLDNRRANLRPATRSQNLANQPKKRTSRSLYKGLWWDYRRSLWRARIKAYGRTIYLGMHPSEETAARAYDAAAREHFGEFACVNFPHPGERSALTGLIKGCGAGAASHVTAAHPSPGGAVTHPARALLAAVSPGRATTTGGVR